MIFSLVDGKKTYITLAVGAASVLANHFGYEIPGTNLDPANWISDLFLLGGAAFGRHAIAKK